MARWRSGEGYREIGRVIGKSPASVFGVLRLPGGYTPVLRVRAAVQLRLAEREEISRRLSAGGFLRRKHWRTQRPFCQSRQHNHCGARRGQIITAYPSATDMQVYFGDPRSPWQRGTNENTHRLLRQYFPKKTSLSVYSPVELDHIAGKLNQRPRKTLDLASPADKLQEGWR